MPLMPTTQWIIVGQGARRMENRINFSRPLIQLFPKLSGISRHLHQLYNQFVLQLLNEVGPLLFF